MIYIINLHLNPESEIPLYQQLVDSIARDIRAGVLAAGQKLPTVRILAESSGASQGTVKHAYDTLEQLGLVEKTQGRGTFVCTRELGRPESKKEQAIAAIDRLLDELEALEFSAKDIRIYLDLKIREREHSFRNVRIGAVDCSPEALVAMSAQIASLSHVDLYEYLLQPLIDSSQRFESGLDLVVTTPTHFDQLSEKMHADKPPVRLVMGLSTDTALRLAMLPKEAKVGILCASERFSGVIMRTCEKYSALQTPPKALLFGDRDRTEQLLRTCDHLILPVSYLKFCSKLEQPLIKKFMEENPFVLFEYRVEKGSLLYLEEQIVKIYERNKVK